MQKLRLPATPLVTVDPYFSIWSFSDRLNESDTKHWTGNENPLTGVITVDGESYKFCGGNDYLDIIWQKSVEVRPLKTVYTFENDKISLTLTFMTPLICSDLKLMSRPVSYVSYKISSLDKKSHSVRIYFDISGKAAIAENGQCLNVGKTDYSVFCGRGDNGVLEKSGDNLLIDWGYLHLIFNGHNAYIFGPDGVFNHFMYGQNGEQKFMKNASDIPHLACEKEYTVDETSNAESFICLGYDDIHSIEYFGEKTDAYWKQDGETFETAAKKAVSEYTDVCRRADEFEAELLRQANKTGEKYADILSAAYRQTIAAHKLTFSGGEIQFFSKECFSNGCIATVDVTYPSIPLFLKYNPELVAGMLNPVFKYAQSAEWTFDFAPHDAGTYPKANGQVYGYDTNTRTMNFNWQMPIEECGNMLIATAAYCMASGNFGYAKKHAPLLDKWADYIVNNGYDPEFQLCTDDFAGHLAHNCNLSIKGILGVAAWAKIALKNGNSLAAEKYLAAAKTMAAEFEKNAFAGDHYKLTFDNADSWSMKYNIIWDKLLDINIFSEKVFATEVDYYLTKLEKYGLPLDSRMSYTKSDWQMWTTVMCDNKKYTDEIVNRMWDMLNETLSRVPFCDWYFTKTASQRGFQNRTVQGGLFVRLLTKDNFKA